jgi:hypothetical protein
MGTRDHRPRRLYLLHSTRLRNHRETSGLPERWQERSDKEDMKKLLQAATSTPDYYLLQARSHLEQRGLTIDEDTGSLARPIPVA